MKYTYLLLFCLTGIVYGSSKPNILYISIDDQNDWIGYLNGHSQAKTPNIQRLVDRGIAFTNAHCTSPLCSPSRTAILTGLSETKTNVYGNGDKFKYKDYKLLPQYFADHGYETYGTGKIHHKKINDKIFEHAFETEQRWSPFISKKQVEYKNEELNSKGTDNPRHVIKNGPDGKTYVMPFNRMPSERSPTSTKGESFDWAAFDLPDTAFGDGLITEWALEKLGQHKEDKPFFMGVGYYRPHIPLYAPKKYFDLYPLESIKLPETVEGDLDDIPQAGKDRAFRASTAGTHNMVLKHKQWKQAVQAYLACVSFVDAQIGQLLDYIENSPYKDNTIVVLFSDHGWHLGEKQTWGKLSAWVHSTRVPFVIAPPKFKNANLCSEAVSLLDIYPTLIDMAQLPQKDLDGLSLLPLLNNPQLDTTRVVKTFVGRETYSLTGKKWKYIKYENKEEELYHIEKDPKEITNLAGDPKNISLIEKLHSLVR